LINESLPEDAIAQRVDELVERIVNEGRHLKFVPKVEQVTFSGEWARKRGQEILYVTERAVFRLGDSGLELVEVAPGVDLESDVLASIPFDVAVEEVRKMPVRLFQPGPVDARTTEALQR
jgi:propionate CoA-transferase